MRFWETGSGIRMCSQLSIAIGHMFKLDDTYMDEIVAFIGKYTQT